MNEQNREETLWKYLDGSCSEAEVIDIENRLKTDTSFAQELAQLKMLDQSLTQTVLQTAPDHLCSSILAKVMQKKSIEHATFRYVPIVILTLLLLLVTIYLVPESTATQSTLIPTDWSFLEVNLQISHSYMVYILGAIAAVSLVWLDLVLGRKLLV